MRQTKDLDAGLLKAFQERHPGEADKHGVEQDLHHGLVKFAQPREEDRARWKDFQSTCHKYRNSFCYDNVLVMGL